MAAMDASWKVHDTSPIRRLGDDLWEVDGSVPKMSLRRRMVVVRLSDGRLVVHSAVNLPEDDMAALEAWGTPAFLIVPNGFHRLDAPAWKARYPDVRLLCPAAFEARVRERVEVDGHLDALPEDPNLSVEPLDGGKEAVLIARSGDRATLVFNDTVFNEPHQPGLMGLFLRLVGSTGGPKVTRVARWFLTDDRRALAAHLRRLADTPGLVRVIPGHGRVVEDDAPAVMRAIAATA
ncbi:MAG: hypothetical protein ACQEXJ_05620 [Myxococcota bacterium]